MTEIITGSIFAAMVENAAAAIDIHKSEIKELNVFPVPDGDTGTNMSLTMNNGALECRKGSSETVGAAAAAAAG